MIKYLIILFIFVVSVFIAYLVIIYMIQKRVKNCDTKKAVDIFGNFVATCCGVQRTTGANTNYPVFIGIDEAGNPCSDVIEQNFVPLESIFEMFYFRNFYDMGNRLVYSFKAALPKKEMTPADLTAYVQKKCDNLVHKFMHRAAPLSTHVNHLVVVTLANDVLNVSIAKNSAGVTENISEENRLRAFYQEESVHCNDLTETWGNNNDLGV